MSVNQYQFLSSLIKQSGVSAVVAIAFGYALTRVYDDLGERNRVLVDLIHDQVRESKAVSDSIVHLSSLIEVRLNTNQK
jgi:hypothetical protein